MIDSEHPDDRDRGAILLLVLAVAIVLSLVVLALANFVAADLRYSQIIDARAKTLSSAESGIEYAVDRLRLNQTLCATDGAAGSPVSLNGTNTSPVGTVLPTALNGTDTRVTCERLDDDFADVAGWAVVIANYGEPPPNDQIQIDMDDHVHLYGPVFLPDPTRTDTDSNSRVEVVDGDLWYTRPNCSAPYTNTALAADPTYIDFTPNIDLTPTSARGGICTTRRSGDAFSEPPVPALPTNTAGDTDSDGFVDSDKITSGRVEGDDLSFPGCHVFSPGRYTMVPYIPPGTSAYFQSGDYHLDFNATWTIQGATVWAGNPGTLAGSEQLGNSQCEGARDADVINPAGATLYVDGSSHIWLESGSNLEIFPRRQGNHIVSIHALSTSWTTTDPGFRSVLRATPSSAADVVVHGLVWAPRGRINIDDESPDATQRFLGGVVVRILWLLRVEPDFEILPASSTGDPPSAGDTTILLTSTSTTIESGVTSTVEAVVAYRPHAVDLDDRVAVTSLRVVD